MAGNLKKVMIIGNLTRDPETKFTGDGTPFASFTVAVNERPRKDQPQQDDQTVFFRVTAWRRQAEIVQQYLTKGMSVFVSGDLSVREYTDRDGQKRTSIEIGNMQDMQMLSPKGDGQQRQQTPQGASVVEDDIPW